MEIDLLEYIAAKTSCEYVSDIKTCLNWSKKSAMMLCIYRIAPEICSLQEWNDAVRYITGNDVHFYERGAAKGFILEFLGANP